MFAPLVEIFCLIDDFCKFFQDAGAIICLPMPPRKRKSKAAYRHRKRKSSMNLSEIMTIIILFHYSNYRCFKHFYLRCILGELRSYFPQATGYTRFVQMMPVSLMPLTVFLNCLKGKETGLYYVDSTTLDVCHIKREKSHKVFKGVAKKGHNSMGWFFGFKLHLVINQLGELMACKLTPGNVDDRKPVSDMMNNLEGWLFGDKGYIGKEFMEKLKKQFVEIFTKVKKNMKERILTVSQKFFLKKRGIIETTIGLLKHQNQIEHTRHRSPINAFVNLVAGLIAYQINPRKPKLKMNKLQFKNKALIMVN